MKAYIGTKFVNAKPMTHYEYCLKFPESRVKNQYESKEGYLVEYDNGYISWSPKVVFDKCYRVITDEEKNIAAG